MELNFGENIKRLRRSRDLTQEALADALGISAQSVSKWECAYGYPDITQLPAIANFFGVTIDELLDNDKNGREQAYKYFEEHFGDFDEASEEKIAFVLDYCRRYPEELNYAYILCCNLSYHIAQICPQNREKYYPLLRQTAKKLLDNVHYREQIAAAMIIACPAEELDEWLDYAAYSARKTRRECLMERYSCLRENELYHLNLSLYHLEFLSILLSKPYPDSKGPAEKAVYMKTTLDMIASFGSGGQVPDGWLAFYGNKQFVYAACLFGAGRMDEGKKEFMSAAEKIRKYHSLPDEYHDMGSPLFGGVRVDWEWNYAVDRKGEKHKLYGTVPLRIYGEADYTLGLLTNPRWVWFDSARHEDYYREVTEWLKGLAEQTSG